MVKQEDLGSVGRSQFDVVLHTFKLKKLRGRDGQTVTDPTQAEAIAFSEGRAADKRGTSKRTWNGRSRIRPNLKNK